MSELPKDLRSIPPLGTGYQFGVIEYIPTGTQICFWVYIDLRDIRTVYLMYQSQLLYTQFHDRIVQEVRTKLKPPEGWSFTIVWYIYQGLEENTPAKTQRNFENMATYLRENLFHLYF